MQLNIENNSLCSFYRERFDSFMIHLSAAKQLKEEDIHKLRVAIKNIRSLLLLVEELKPDRNEGSKLMKQLKDIFTASGKLRTVQVCVSILQESSSEIPAELVAVLKTETDSIVLNIRESFSQFDVDKFQKRVNLLCAALNHVDVTELESMADGIILNELEIIKKLHSSSRGEEHLHEIRKLLKIVKTLYQLLLSLHENENRRQKTEIVSQTETLLGNWHDQKILEKWLFKTEIELAQPDLKRLFRNLKNQNTKNKMELKNESDESLRSHFSSY